jgi:prepilin-type N-terminal cleavage/methylation domain-containing protein
MPLVHRRPRAFTLIEILVVVMILGILAAIIIGLFGNTTADANLSSLKDNLRAMRSGLQIYVAHHGSYPAASSFEAQMTQYTDEAGNTSATPSSTYRFGPYILALPALPVGTNKGKTAITGAAYTSGFGWQYDSATGDLRANCQDTESDGQGNYFHTF